MLNGTTESETLALRDLLYLVTHDEATNAAVRASYGSCRAGNPEMLTTVEFAAALDSLYARICK